MEETHEEQVLRCLREMVEDGTVAMKEEENGEQYFALVKPE